MSYNTIIATIKLGRGQVGFYDPISRIHLTLAKPDATVYSGTNCAALRRAVKNGTLIVTSGTLGKEIPQFKLVKNDSGRVVLVSNAAEENKPVVKEEEAPKVAPVVEEKAPVIEKEEITEEAEKVKEVVEQPAEEKEEPVKTSAKKKTTKKSKKAE